MTTIADELVERSRIAPIPLGEELPIFCEACGYSLHGLPRIRCEHCSVLHFHCPECGHHQPINTLRPAVQKMLGRLRAWWLGFSVFFRLNFFGWLLAGWAALGDEFSRAISYSYRYASESIVMEMALVIAGFGVGFGLVSRMFLLRWRLGVVIGVILGILSALAFLVGVYLWHLGRRDTPFDFGAFAPFLLMIFTSVWIGAMLSWPSWVALVLLFLPKRTGKQLLDWQRSLSDPSGLARN